MNPQFISKLEAGQIKETVEIIVSTATPLIVKAVAATQPGVSMVGELLHTEPARDYRKELWIGALTAAMPISPDVGISAPDIADAALAAFDERFPND